MPGLISAETAAREIISGLATRNFLIQFPKSFTRKMGWLRWLPDHTFFGLSARAPAIRNPDPAARPTMTDPDIITRYAEAFAALAPDNMASLMATVSPGDPLHRPVQRCSRP